ncbi:MAG TPA: hypothetical protein VND98_02615 [Solirubrobacterales bacterium]|nr:hypothetical protein [Solirubrobacterales bacterium]
MRNLPRSLRELHPGEQGIALPAALMVTMISFSLAMAAVFATVEAQRGTARDSGSKNGIAAADAGANVAMLRLNEFANGLNGSYPCVGLSGGTLVKTATETEGWCPEITGTVGGATYSYRISPWVSGSPTKIVATGTAAGVSRRIEILLKPSSKGGIFATEGVIGKEEIKIGGNATIKVGIGTNGNVNQNGSNAEVCGNIRHGVGKENHAKQCAGYSVTEGESTLPPVSSFMPPNIASENSDYRLALCTKKTPVKEPAGCESDTYSETWSSTNPWNPNTEVLEPTGTLTLGGSNYWLCSLVLAGHGELIMAKGAQVRLFFRTPEECGHTSGEFTQISLTGQARIYSSSYVPSENEFEVPGFYLLGSSTVITKVNIEGKADNEMVIYGPDTQIRLAGNGSNSSLEGAVAGKTVTVEGNGTIQQASGFKPPEIGGSTLYSRQSYVECQGGAATSPPSAGC